MGVDIGDDLGIEVNFSAGSRSVRYRLNLDIERFSHFCIFNLLNSGVLYGPEVSAFLVRALRPGDVFVDVGAHIGYFSMMAANLVGPSGAVFSVEPEPGNFDRLKRHAIENGFQQIEAFNLAFAAEASETTFHLNADNDGGHALWNPGLHPFNLRTRTAPQLIRVRTATLDTFKAIGQRPARVIKLNTEGAEHQILRGASRLLGQRRTPFVVCDVNTFGLEQMGSSQLSFRAYLAKFGYSTFALDPEGSRPRLVPPDRLIAANAAEESDRFTVLFSTPEAVASI